MIIEFVSLMYTQPEVQPGTPLAEVLSILQAEEQWKEAQRRLQASLRFSHPVIPTREVVMNNFAKLYSVCLWLTHPDNENDDCMTGEDFATEAEARAVMGNLSSAFDMVYHSDCAFVELDGPDCHEVVERPGVLKRARRNAAADDADWKREQAMQAGMAFGCDGYNDEMGY